MMAKEVVVYFTIEQITLRHQDTSLVNTPGGKEIIIIGLKLWKTSRETTDGT